MPTYGILSGSTVIAGFVVPLQVKNNKPSFNNDTMSLKRVVKSRTAQRWEIETRLEPLSGGANDLFVHFVTNADTGQFNILMPQNYGVILKRTSVSNPTVGVAGVAGSSTITIANNAGLIPAGTFIRFANHTKVYMTTTDITGNGVVGIYPTLRVGTAVGTAISHRDNVQMLCRYDTDTLSGMEYSDGILMDIGTVRLVEAL